VSFSGAKAQNKELRRFEDSGSFLALWFFGNFPRGLALSDKLILRVYGFSLYS
jgi:hypothetical protein